MSFIGTTAPAQATDEVATLYSHLQGHADYLPNYARVFCHRPGLMAHISTTMQALKDPMEPRLWCLVNLAAARASKSSYCSLAFAKRLILKHFSESELLSILRGDENSAASSKERIAMAFAARVARDSSAIGERDVKQLRDAGFDDTQIFDLAAAAAWRCFFARLPDALGARPDRALGQFSQPLLQLLLVGRGIDTEPLGQFLQQSSEKSSHVLQACEEASA